MTNQPEITKTTKEINKCGYCAAPCWFQAVCSDCQITLLVDAKEHSTWEFAYVAMWAKRLNKDVYQEVKLIKARKTIVDYLRGAYSVEVTFVDGSGKQCTANYVNELSQIEACSLIAILPDAHQLNGLHWHYIR